MQTGNIPKHCSVAGILRCGRELGSKFEVFNFSVSSDEGQGLRVRYHPFTATCSHCKGLVA